jgi:hypothetical protein
VKLGGTCFRTSPTRSVGFPEEWEVQKPVPPTVALSALIDLPKNFRRDFERAEARGVIENLRGGDDFIGFRFVEQLFQPAPHRFGRTNGRIQRSMLDRRSLRGAPTALHAFYRRRQFSRMAANQIQEHHLGGGQEPACLGVRVRRENAHPNHDMRPNERFGWLEFPPVKLERDLEIIGREMRRERERQSEFRSQTGAEIARTKKVKRDVQAGARNGHDRLTGHGRTEVRLQLDYVLWESVTAAAERTAESAGRELIAPGRATQTEIDAAGIERLERAELFGDDERRVVRKHDPAGADPDAFRLASNMADDDGSRRAGDARKVVMFRQPVTMVAPTLCVLREIHRVSEGQRGIAILKDR